MNRTASDLLTLEKAVGGFVHGKQRVMLMRVANIDNLRLNRTIHMDGIGHIGGLMICQVSMEKVSTKTRERGNFSAKG
jgi:hypothetical protein